MNRRQTLAITSTSVLAAGMAHGAVQYTAVNTELIGNQTATYPFDLNSDGSIDCQAWFDSSENKPFIDCRTNTLPTGISSTNGWTLSKTNGGAPLTLFGAAIDSGYAVTYPPNKVAYLYEQYDNSTLVGDWPNDAVTDGYVGLALINDSTTNFGYAHLIYDGTTSPKTLTFVGYGYETTPGVGIVAGAQVLGQINT